MIYRISDRIKYLRDKAGLKQIDLAKRLGISRSAVNSWEMSLSLPSIANVMALAKIFHVSADYLLSLSNDITVDISPLSDEERALVMRLVECLTEKRTTS